MEKFLVVGLGSSGVSVTNFLVKNNEYTAVFDKEKGKARDFIDKNLIPKSVEVVDKLCAKSLSGVTKIIISPGVVLDKKIINIIKEKGIEIEGELAYSSRFCPAPIYAITGTNGKTTTATFLAQILKYAKKKTWALGNIGTPFSSVVDKIALKDSVVCEVSSFQLENSAGFSPYAVGITNIEPDHLDRYKTFDNYLDAKKIILSRVGEGRVFLNFDDYITRTLGENKTNCEYFSTGELPRGFNGFFLRDNEIFTRKGDEIKPIINISKFKLVGEHNKSNLLCAVSLALYSGILPEVIEKAVRTLRAPKHRLEFVGKINGALYYDDSKATNIASSKMAVDAFGDKKIWLLLGGSDKGENFKKFIAKLPNNVVRLVCFGKMGKKIAKIAQKEKRQGIFLCKNLLSAFICAKQGAKKDEIVLLSPACASFDEFANFEERGEYFSGLVSEYKDI